MISYNEFEVGRMGYGNISRYANREERRKNGQRSGKKISTKPKRKTPIKFNIIGGNQK